MFFRVSKNCNLHQFLIIASYYPVTNGVFSLQEKAQEIQEQLLSLQRSSSPDIQAQVITQLTPPSSNKKGNNSITEDKEKSEKSSPDIKYEGQDENLT